MRVRNGIAAPSSWIRRLRGVSAQTGHAPLFLCSPRDLAAPVWMVAITTTECTDGNAEYAKEHGAGAVNGHPLGAMSTRQDQRLSLSPAAHHHARWLAASPLCCDTFQVGHAMDWDTR